jgi:hypothetical protein
MSRGPGRIERAILAYLYGRAGGAHYTELSAAAGAGRHSASTVRRAVASLRRKGLVSTQVQPIPSVARRCDGRGPAMRPVVRPVVRLTPAGALGQGRHTSTREVIS